MENTTFHVEVMLRITNNYYTKDKEGFFFLIRFFSFMYFDTGPGLDVMVIYLFLKYHMALFIGLL